MPRHRTLSVEWDKGWRLLGLTSAGLGGSVIQPRRLGWSLPRIGGILPA